MTQRETRFVAAVSTGNLDATWLIPARPQAQLVFAHGAGADHRHKTMQALAEAFAGNGIATLRFNFPFMQAGKRRVDSQQVSVRTIVDIARLAEEKYPNRPLFLGGHSFGGRMVTHAVVDTDVACRALVLCSFPLHPAKKPATQRADHLTGVRQPMLFLSGTRDDLADWGLLSDVVERLPRHHKLHWLETANHSYAVLKRKRSGNMDVFAEIAQQAQVFITRQLGG